MSESLLIIGSILAIGVLVASICNGYRLTHQDWNTLVE